MSNKASLAQARAFVRKVSLSESPQILASARADALVFANAPAAAAQFDFDGAKNQALVVGSDIVSFVKGVTEARRKDIVNSALLAQLVANNSVKNKRHVFKWYDTYFETLTRIGWVVQDRQFADHLHSSASFQAHEIVLSIATTLLGPGSAALGVVKDTLGALQTMKKDSPWITLFNRESKYARNGRFQITLAEDTADGQFLVTLLAFALVAQSDLTQILFFKFGSNDVRVKYSAGKVTINTEVLDFIRDDVRQRIANYAKNYVKGLPDI